MEMSLRLLLRCSSISLNDKFIRELKKEDKTLADKDNLEESLSKMSENDYGMLMMSLDENTARLKTEHLSLACSNVKMKITSLQFLMIPC